MEYYWDKWAIIQVTSLETHIARRVLLKIHSHVITTYYGGRVAPSRGVAEPSVRKDGPGCSAIKLNTT